MLRIKELVCKEKIYFYNIVKNHACIYLNIKILVYICIYTYSWNI